jgi:very-short-patch-repair endonuclease
MLVCLQLDRIECLSDTNAYRHERRKDQLLQVNGYLVLRFLAEDVGKTLDRVLDTIMSTIVRARSTSRTARP